MLQVTVHLFQLSGNRIAFVLIGVCGVMRRSFIDRLSQAGESGIADVLEGVPFLGEGLAVGCRGVPGGLMNAFMQVFVSCSTANDPSAPE